MPYYPPTGDAATSLTAYSLLGNTTGSTAAGASTQYPVLGTPGFALSGGLTLGQVTGSVATYAEFDLQNTSAAVTASTDFVVNADNATNSTHYGNFGINSSTFTGTGSLNLAGAAYLTATTGDLVIGTTTANLIRFVTNGASTDAMQIAITMLNAVTLNSTVNKVTITAPATGSTLTIPDGVTLNAGSGGTLTATAVAAAGQLPATATNDSATAGKVGEEIEAEVSVGSPVSLTSTVVKTITSISLTAGDWDVYFEAGIAPAASTTVTRVLSSISLTADTLDMTTRGRNTDYTASGATPGLYANPSSTVGPARFSLSGTTTIYGVQSANFGVSTLGGFGLLRARRMR